MCVCSCQWELYWDSTAYGSTLPGQLQADAHPSPYETRFCSRFLPVKTEFFLAPVAFVLPPEGFRLWALYSALRQFHSYELN